MSSQKVPVIFLAFANDRVDDTAYLRNLPKELNGIRKALQPAVRAGLCELVERSNATIQTILDVFQEDFYKNRIAIFHYGGHANGYQLLLETLEGEHAAAHSEGFVSFLGKQKGLKMIFLNGCSSEQQALDLVKEGIPAVVGTLQSINDDVATNLAIRFYKGLANGRNLEKAWLEAVDEVKIQKGTANMRDLFFDDMEEVADETTALHRSLDHFPWQIHFREGAEIIKNWNLPEAVNNPLFGLPEAPSTHLPEQPYVFLQRYNSQHSELFFGRSYYIRELYNRCLDPKSAPIILFYGQSGVGKSSMLDAGLFPRLQQVCDVIYIRRDYRKGLVDTLREALGLATQQLDETAATDQLQQIEELERVKSVLAPEMHETIQQLIEQLQQKTAQIQEKHAKKVDVQLPNNSREAWIARETKTDKSLVILLDQVEEMYTKPNLELKGELEDFLKELALIFKNTQTAPKGKLILSYRKEYNPEIQEALKSLQLPREEIFLKKLDRRDIVEVIEGLTSTSRLRNRYQLSIEEELPVVIADDLLEDRDSPIAPILQILLTKLWRFSSKDTSHYFSIELYQRLRKGGILMHHFFREQMAEFRKQHPQLEESGLALDILYFHTTKMGTANSRAFDQLAKRYNQPKAVIEELINTFKALYLLSDIGTESTSLAHDTLAPIVQEAFRNSAKLGQRASLILENKVVAYQQSPETVIDSGDLKIVEEGEAGMRAWKASEQALIEQSRKFRKKMQTQKRLIRRIGIASLIVIILTSVVAVRSWIKAEEKAKESKLLAISAYARDIEKTDPSKALKLASLAYGNQTEGVPALVKRAMTDIAFKSSYSDEFAIKHEPRELLGDNLVFSDKIIASKQASDVADRKDMFTSKENYILTTRHQDGAQLRSINGKLIGTLSGAEVIQAHFSSDENWLATSHRDSKIKIWEIGIADTKPKKLINSPDEVRFLQFLPDTNLIVTVTNKGLIALSTTEGKALWTHQEKVTQLESVRLLSNRTLLLTYGYHQIKLIKLGESENVQQYEFEKLSKAYSNYVGKFREKPQRVVASTSGKFLIVQTTDSLFLINPDLSPFPLPLSAKSADNVIWHMAISDDERCLLTSNGDVTTIRELAPTGKLRYNSGKGISIEGDYPQFLTNTSYIITVSGKAALIWNRKGELVARLSGHQDKIEKVATFSKNRKIITAGRDNRIKIWSPDMLKDLNTTFYTSKPQFRYWSRFSPKFYSNGKIVLGIINPTTLNVWDATGHLLDSLSLSNTGMTPSFSYDKTKLIMTSKDSSTIYQITAAKKLQYLSTFPSKKGTTKLRFLPTSQNMVTISDNSILILDLSGNTLTSIDHPTKVVDYSLSPDGSKIITIDEKGKPYFWNQNGRLIDSTSLHQNLAGSLKELVCSPDSRYLIINKKDSVDQLWTTNGKFIATLGKGNTMAFSSNGKYIFVGMADGDVTIFNIQGKLVNVLKEHTGSIVALDVAHQKPWVLTASKDGIIKIWEMIGNQDQAELLCTIPTIHYGKDLEKAFFSSDDQHEYVLVTTPSDLSSIKTPPLIFENLQLKMKKVFTKEELLNYKFTEEDIKGFVEKGWIELNEE